MTWKIASKDLSISKVVAHNHMSSGVVGRAPGISTFSFSPLELYGAAARCSHLHLINPAIVTVESLMIEAMLAHHVDDFSTDFAIQSSADNLKDFVKSYFAGTIAAGTAYLAMINDGYVWSDHFENISGGKPTVAKSPDFVFSGLSTGVALVESKGSRSGPLSKFNTTIRDGYIQQVEPHLGCAVGGVTPTHGYCIGTHFPTHSKAETIIHHTTNPLITSGSSGTGGYADSADLSTVQRHSYSTALELAHGLRLGERLRSGERPEDWVIFNRFEWLGRHWLTRFGLWDDFPMLKNHRHFGKNFMFFAIEERIASNVLARFLDKNRAYATTERIEPLPKELITRARQSELGQQGAIFPDGLALLGHWPKIDGNNWVEWNPNDNSFQPLNPRR